MRTLALFAACSLALAADAYSVFRSEDGGRSWAGPGEGLPAGSRINAFAAAGRAVVAATDAGLSRSLDQGRTWRAVAGPGRSLALALQGPNLFAGTAGEGIWMSADAGETWRRLPGFEARNVRSIVGANGRIYAGGDKGGVFASADGGQTWLTLSGGLPPQAQIFALEVAQGRLFAGLYAKGLYTWDEPGQRWTRGGSVMPLVLAAIGETLVVGHNPGGLLWSGDLTNFARSQMGTLAADAPVWTLAAGRTRVFAGAAAGVYVSGDRGRQWTRTAQGLPPDSPGISFLVTDKFVLAATHSKVPVTR